MSVKMQIDGNDALTNYGIFITEGGMRNLLTWPKFKTPETNDWHEYDGLEVDTANLVLDARDVSIAVAASNAYVSCRRLINDLATGGTHTFTFPELGRSLRLRFMSSTGADALQKLGTITLRMREETPMADYSYQAPVSSLPTNNDYRINSHDGTAMVPLSSYGVRILAGTDKTFMFVPQTKKDLTRSSKYQAGETCYAQTQKYGTQDVTLNCLIHEATPQALWRNYDALLFDLTRNQTISLYAKPTNRTYQVLYSGQTVQEYVPTENWLKFKINLKITGNIR